MEKIYIAKNLIKHNGRRYAEGEEIPLEAHDAAQLLASKSIEVLEIPSETEDFLEGKTNKIPAGTTIITNEDVKNLQTNTETPFIANNTHPDQAGDGASPVQESNPGSTPEANSEEQTNPPAVQTYAEMTNNQQIDYLSSLSDEEFKTRYDELFEASKSKSKTFAEKRMKSLNTENETQE